MLRSGSRSGYTVTGNKSFILFGLIKTKAYINGVYNDTSTHHGVKQPSLK